jgi:hypothetical protein
VSRKDFAECFSGFADKALDSDSALRRKKMAKFTAHTSIIASL